MARFSLQPGKKIQPRVCQSSGEIKKRAKIKDFIYL
jgi:hypothetical protein